MKMEVRVQAFLVAVVALALIHPSAGAGPAQCEPGLTARIASLASASLPAQLRADGGVNWDVLDRLQMMPVVASDDPAKQLALIYDQVKQGKAAPELLASAARAAVRLSLPDGEEPAWQSFVTAIALRTTQGDIQAVNLTTTGGAAALAQDLSKQGLALKQQALDAAASGDGAASAALRKKAASLAAAGVAAAWKNLLDLQPPPAPAVPAQAVDQTPPPVQAVAEPAAVSAPPTGPMRFIGNKTSKKLHLPTCRFLPSPQNQVQFADRADAIRAGFDPCKVCKP